MLQCWRAAWRKHSLIGSALLGHRLQIPLANRTGEALAAASGATMLIISYAEKDGRPA